MLAIHEFNSICCHMDIEYNTSINVSYSISVIGICRGDPITCINMDELIITERDNLKDKSDDTITGDVSFTETTISKLLRLLDKVPQIQVIGRLRKITFDGLYLEHSYNSMVHCVAQLCDKCNFKIQSVSLTNSLVNRSTVGDLALIRYIEGLLEYEVVEFYFSRQSFQVDEISFALFKSDDKWAKITKFELLDTPNPKMSNGLTARENRNYTYKGEFISDKFSPPIKTNNTSQAPSALNKSMLFVKASCANNKGRINASRVTLQFIVMWKFARQGSLLEYLNRDIMLMVAKLIYNSKNEYEWLDAEDRLELRVNKVAWNKN